MHEAICKMPTFGKWNCTPHLNPLPLEGRGEGRHGLIQELIYPLSSDEGRGEGEGLTRIKRDSKSRTSFMS
jgi:hypothetical protein